MADNWQLKAILSAVDKMSPVLKSVGQTARTTRKYLADVGSSATALAGQVGVPLGLLSGAAGALSVAGLKKIVTDFSDVTSKISDSSRGLGLTTDEYQRMGFIAEQSGTSVEELGSSLGRLNKGIALAAAGKNKDFAALFQKAGISMRDANGQLRSATDLLPEVADLFARNQNAATQARMGNAIFGKSWQALAPLLNDGSAGINQLALRYKELGLNIDQGAIKAGDEFGDKMGEAQRVVNSYSYAIGAKLLPVLAPLLEKTIQWAVANRELISTRVATFVAEFADSMSKVDWNAVVQGIADIVNGVRGFVEWIGGAKNALIALIIVMNAQAIAATIGLGMSIFRLGMHITGMTGKALASVAPLQTMTTGMKGAELRAATLGNALGRLSAAGGLVTAAMTGWQVGGMLNEYILDPLARLVSGDKEGTLGTALYDLFNDDPMAKMAAQDAGRRPLVSPQSRGRVDGSIRIDVNGLPPGSRVEQLAAGGDMPIDLNAGYSSAALGMP